MSKLAGKKIVFTGFRDATLRERIEAAGGKVTTSVSHQTDYLVFDGPKGETSTKTQEAKKIGVKVMSKEAFVGSMFSKTKQDKGFFARLFGNKTSPKVKKPVAYGPLTNVVKPMTYLTHDNGGRPFEVSIATRTFTVRSCADPDGEDDCVYTKIAVKPTAYIRVWAGIDKDGGKKFEGNTCLFELVSNTKSAHKYMYVGERIYTFTTKVPITGYASPVFGSDVAYAYAVAADKTYLLLEDTWLPDEMVVGKDPYDILYAMEDERPAFSKKHKISHKLIHDRLW